MDPWLLCLDVQEKEHAEKDHQYREDHQSELGLGGVNGFFSHQSWKGALDSSSLLTTRCRLYG